MNITEKLSIVGISLGLLSIGYSFYNQTKIEKTLISKMADGIALDISDSMVSEAVNAAVEKEVVKAVKHISKEISYNTRTDIQRAVKSEVDSAHSTIVSSVSVTLAKQAADIDMQKLKKEVKEKAKEMIVEKFDDNLESLLGEFNNKLSDISKIYSSIAESMTKKQGSGTTLTIGV